MGPDDLSYIDAVRSAVGRRNNNMVSVQPQITDGVAPVGGIEHAPADDPRQHGALPISARMAASVAATVGLSCDRAAVCTTSAPMRGS